MPGDIENCGKRLAASTNTSPVSKNKTHSGDVAKKNGNYAACRKLYSEPGERPRTAPAEVPAPLANSASEANEGALWGERSPAVALAAAPPQPPVNQKGVPETVAERLFNGQRHPFFENLTQRSIDRRLAKHEHYWINSDEQRILRRLMAFLTNDKEAKKFELDEANRRGAKTGMAILGMWKILIKICDTGALDMKQKAVLGRLVASYDDFYASSLMYISSEVSRFKRSVFSNILSENLGPFLFKAEPTLLTAGYHRHCLVVRVALTHTGPLSRIPDKEGTKLWGYFKSTRKDLGPWVSLSCPGRSGSYPLSSVYHARITEKFLKECLLKALSFSNYLIVSSLLETGPRRRGRPVSSENGCEIWYLKDGEPTFFRTVLGDLQGELLKHSREDGDLYGRNPLPNYAKVTIHNAGGGALSGKVQSGKTRMYDERCGVPLVELVDVVRQLMSAKALKRDDYASVAGELKKYYKMAGKDAQEAIWLDAQNMGNCTIYNQLLAIKYDLGHPEDWPQAIPGWGADQASHFVNVVNSELFLQMEKKFSTSMKVNVYDLAVHALVDRNYQFHAENGLQSSEAKQVMRALDEYGKSDSEIAPSAEVLNWAFCLRRKYWAPKDPVETKALGKFLSLRRHCIKKHCKNKPFRGWFENLGELRAWAVSEDILSSEPNRLSAAHKHGLRMLLAMRLAAIPEDGWSQTAADGQAEPTHPVVGGIQGVLGDDPNLEIFVEALQSVPEEVPTRQPAMSGEQKFSGQ